MSDLHLPWLELAILSPLIGAPWVSRLRNSDSARRWSVLFSSLSLAAAAGAVVDFELLEVAQAVDRWRISTRCLGRELFVIDQVNGPLLLLTALLYFLTIIAKVRAQVGQFSFARVLVSESIALATFGCKEPWTMIALLAVGVVPPWIELRARRQSSRVYAAHALLFVSLLIAGWVCVEREGADHAPSLWAIAPLFAAILVRSGIAPFHCWMTDLFEHASFGTALLFVTPIVGAYAAVRMVLPIAPDWVLRSIGLLSLATAVYAAGMALVQREGRRFFCYLFLSHSALVFVGLVMATPIGLTGALCVWLSIGLALGGFGLTLRALEARRGRLCLSEFQGLYEHTPSLAMCFVLTGLASVGFPGTFGFVGAELLVEGAVEAYPFIGIAVVIAAALNGIAVVKAYFLLFTGKRHSSSISLQSRGRERFAVLTLAALILVGGLVPQPGVLSRSHAAAQLLRERNELAQASRPGPNFRRTIAATASNATLSRSSSEVGER